MIITAYRLCHRKYSAKSGVGAKLYGGRWNPKGLEVIYAAESVSLAMLEVLVHFTVLPRDYVMCPITIPDSVSIERVPKGKLPKRWNSPAGSIEAQNFGGIWAIERRSAVLSVPSSIVRSERIYIINPKHSEFNDVEFGTPEAHRFDPRLK